jgi:hypothetical protein
MATKAAMAAVPSELRKVSRRFEHWRGAHTGRLPIPEDLWASAAEVAKEHGRAHATPGEERLESPRELRLELWEVGASATARPPKPRARSRQEGSRHSSAAIHRIPFSGFNSTM